MDLIIVKVALTTLALLVAMLPIFGPTPWMTKWVLPAIVAISVLLLLRIIWWVL